MDGIRTLQSVSENEPEPSSAPGELRAGLVLGAKYLLLRPLGLGGMGQVWLATNLATAAEVAVKVLLPSRAASSDALARFRREAEATATLSHRGIVRVFDLMELDPAHGTLVMVMEVLHGESLGARLEREGRLSVSATLQVVLPILSALSHAHARDVVHRDLKPDNIILALEPDGAVLPKLVDFGISKSRNPALSITIEGELVGTPCYMSPEQSLGREVDERSDVFAAGIVLYECLAGLSPFLGYSLPEVLVAVRERDPEPIPSIPKRLWKVIARALHKDPAKRYATACELAEALRAAAPREVDASVTELHWSVPPGVVAVTGAASRTSRRRALAAALAGCLAGALVTAASVSSSALRPTAAAHERAPRALGPKRVAPVADVVTPEEPATLTVARPVANLGAPPSRARVSLMRDPGF